MDLYEFRCYMCDDSCYISIFDLRKGDAVYHGPANEMPRELENEEVMSFDLLASENPWVKAAIEINIEGTEKC